MENTKRVGSVSEAAVLAALARRGKAVLVPWGDNERYDLVVEEAGEFSRIQCKTGRVMPCGAIVASTSSQSTTGSRNYRGQAEFFGVHCPELNKTYLVPVGVCGAQSVYLRLDPPKNNQRKKILWAKDFEI